MRPLERGAAVPPYSSDARADQAHFEAARATLLAQLQQASQPSAFITQPAGLPSAAYSLQPIGVPAESLPQGRGGETSRKGRSQARMAIVDSEPDFWS